MDALFLDAAILFSAAYREEAGVRRLWNIADARLLSSPYAVEEARRNLPAGTARKRLEVLIRSVRLVDVVPDYRLPRDVQLPEKDRPILLAALASEATYLITGDITHFGPYLGRKVGSVRILTPARYLTQRP